MAVIISILQLVLIFSLNKTLTSMWVLLNNLQFFIFIGQWQIRYPSYCQTIFDEMTKIALGQYFDDFEFGNKVQDELGIQTKDDEVVEE